MPGAFHHLRSLFCLALLLFAAWPLHAQQSGVEMRIQERFFGVGGYMQRGAWMPVRLDLTNQSAENVEVTCRWFLKDDDNDELIAERPNITLGPLRTQGVWLYGNLPMSTAMDQTWVFQAVSSKTGELIVQEQRQLAPVRMIDSSVNMVGICGRKSLGLNPWKRWSTQHEKLHVVDGLSLEEMPDRWYGFDGLSALVWAPGGGEPTSSKMSGRSKRALREWVYRGGHLVIVLPYGGQQWTSQDSDLSDLLGPLKASDIKQTEARPPISVFRVLNSTDRVPMLWFDVDQKSGFSTLAELQVPQSIDPNAKTVDKPLIIGRRLGFGQVTLVGIDLSNSGVVNAINSFQLHQVWTRIFSWRASKTGALLPSSLFDDQQTSSQYVEAKDANKTTLGTWVAPRVARQRETGPAVGIAVVVFIIYAVVAAFTFPGFLRSKGWDRHSWLLFVGVVVVFSAISWGGAWMMRPASTSAAHFTVLDIDGNSDLVHARSWQSLLIPSFTTAELDVPSESDGFAKMDVVNLISSPGHSLAPESPGYPDQRTYRFDASAPHTLDVPMRSTTKSLVVDYLGKINKSREGLAKPWTMPQKSIRVGSNGQPVGTITHYFPDVLTDVHIIYCPGGAQQPARPGRPVPDERPYVYTYRNANNAAQWNPGTPLALPNSWSRAARLWVRPRPSSSSRVWNSEGFLGDQVHQRRFGSSGNGDSDVVRDLPILSFYDALPPPIYETAGDPTGGFVTPGSRYNVYNRALMRHLDMTHLITGRRLIIIGHLRNSPSPVPMTVDGDEVDSEGWTVVRWIYDF